MINYPPDLWNGFFIHDDFFVYHAKLIITIIIKITRI